MCKLIILSGGWLHIKTHNEQKIGNIGFALSNGKRYVNSYHENTLRQKITYGYFRLNYSLNFIVPLAGHFDYEHDNAKRNHYSITKTHRGYIRP